MNNEKKVKILKETIVELRRRYELIQKMYKSAQVKMFTFMGAGFGLLTYLYSGSDKTDFYFLPTETYGKILYLLAFFLIFSSMVKLYLSIKGVYWEFPLHLVKLKDIEQKYTELEFYTYIRDDYLRAIDLTQKTYSAVHKSLSESSLMLAVGGILVVLIKIFNK